jgi:hypothetical protein
LRDAEFRVFSQFGDDGIIQYLIHLLEPVEERFIEFGVEDYGESNTRFLLMNDNWTGLVIDGSREHVAHICRQDYHSRHTLTAAHAFVDRSNVNALFRDNGFTGGLGLLSIDIDGNDYWVWEAIDCVEPVVVVCEYNAVFGASRAVTVPYELTFQRTRAHPSNLYFGASLGALCLLAGRKGFAFVGANSAGNNAYFVRQDRLGPLRALRAGVRRFQVPGVEGCGGPVHLPLGTGAARGHRRHGGRGPGREPHHPRGRDREPLTPRSWGRGARNGKTPLVYQRGRP